MRAFLNSLSQPLLYTVFFVLIVFLLPLAYYLYEMFGFRVRPILFILAYLYPVVCAWEVHKGWELHRRGIKDELQGRLFTSIREDERKADQGHYSWSYITIVMIITAVVLLFRLTEPNLIGTYTGLYALIIFVGSIIIYLKRQKEKNVRVAERRNSEFDQ